MRKDIKENNVIVNKTFQLSVMIVGFCDQLITDNKFSISNQLLRSGTSIAANIRESQNSESKNDFIHKLKIASKEIEETEYWIELIGICYPKYNTIELQKLLEEVAKITTAIITALKSK